MDRVCLPAAPDRASILKTSGWVESHFLNDSSLSSCCVNGSPFSAVLKNWYRWHNRATCGAYAMARILSVSRFAVPSFLHRISRAFPEMNEERSAESSVWISGSCADAWITGKAARGSAPKRRIRKILFMGDGRNCIHT